MNLLQTWRWFGPNDPVSLLDAKQAGASGIVTALHEIPHGEVWPKEAIKKRKAIIEKAGLSWPVVESITVHEDIKTRTGAYKKFIEKYKTSLRNVAAHGIKIVTYNFMPVNDWTRTDISYLLPSGSKALYFNWVDLAVFDGYILSRKNFQESYPPAVLKLAEKRFKSLSQKQQDSLAAVVMFGIPGEKRATIQTLRTKLKPYASISSGELADNLKSFLKEIAPVAEDCRVKLAIHPDDPPFPILGLPRVVSTEANVTEILAAYNSTSNGLCFCTGSFGARADNDLVGMVKRLGDKINFVHLRSTKRDAHGNFYEAEHLGGDFDMAEVMASLVALQQRRKEAIPFRPDHGHQMLDDLHKKTNPGYSAIGRLKGLAELRGLEAGILHSLNR